jgi:hypothetical protein
MHKKLLEEAFNKAKEETGSERITHLSQHLSDFIVEDSREPYGERILRDYYNRIINNSEERICLKAHAVESLSHYLGFSNYSDFIKISPTETTNNSTNSKTFLNTYKYAILISLFIIVALFIFNSVTKQRFMIWDNDHYIEVNFDTKKYSLNQLKIFKEERVELFKKVKPSCDYVFFDQQQNVKLWYGKNISKELEYFTALGLHPETGKTLKPITLYMIDKHICK